MKRFLSFIITLAMALSMLSAFSVFAAQTVITTADQLIKIKDDPSGSYKLGADIDMSASPLTDCLAAEFSGTLDGDGHKITGIKITADKNAALFAVLTGTVKNLTLGGEITVTGAAAGVAAAAVAANSNGGKLSDIASDIKLTVSAPGAFAGGMIGIADGNTEITNCKNTGNITFTAPAAASMTATGGIVGYIVSAKKLETSENSASVSASGDDAVNMFTGGIAGMIACQMSVKGCLNTGDIASTAASAAHTGGIVGVTGHHVTISSCMNEGSVSTTVSGEGEAGAGGIAGAISGNYNAAIINCASFGNVCSTDTAGGIAGYFWGLNLMNTFVSPDAVITAISAARTAGSVTVSGQQKNNYTQIQSSYDGFDFTKYWEMDGQQPKPKNTGVPATSAEPSEPQEPGGSNTEPSDPPAPPTFTMTFTDVKKTDWFYDEVLYAVQNDIFDGRSDEIFAPKDNITRAEFVQVLANLDGLDVSDKNVKTRFKDVPSGKWYTPAIKWASENKIVSGFGNDEFRPTENITREQMCVMIIGYAKYKGYTLKEIEAKETFTDNSSISSWAQKEVYACQMANIINGVGDGSFRPKASATRAQVATVFQVFHQDYIA